MGVESLPVMTCGEVQQKECLTHKYRKYVKDQKMCLLWQGFHHKQRNAAKETKKKSQRDFLRAVEPVMELQQQENLTFSKAAILLGCTRQYVYKLVEHGKLPASRLSSRMALIRRSDIEKMFEANPYNPLFMLSCKACVNLPRKNLGAPICTIVFHRTRVYRRARL